MQAILIGADPEFFVQESSVSDKIISVIGKLGGTKEKPLPVPKGGLQEDNVLAEININPAANVDEFIGNITTVRAELDSRLSPHNSVVKTCHIFTNEELAEDYRALEMGCSPDYNCWTVDINDSPDPYNNLRTAGGHVHFGYENPTGDKSLAIARMADFYLGLPSILLDDDGLRREMYGQAGACRPKAYGVEYRTLSNFWLKEERLIRWVYDQAVRCVKEVDRLENLLSRCDSDLLQHTINTSNVEGAKALVERLGLVMPEGA